MPNYGLIFYPFKDFTLEQFLDYAKETGFTHVELFVSNIWNEKEDKQEIGRVREEVAKRGLAIAALGAGNDFVVTDPDVVDFQVKRMHRVIDIARELGVNILRTEGGWPKEGVPEEKWVDAIVECLKRCRDAAESAEIHLAVDNHGLVTNDADLQIEIFERVDSPFVGASLDTMNYRWRGHDLETIRRYYRIIAPYTRYMHFKDGIGSRGEYRGRPLGEGEIELDYALQCLLDAGYGGVWSLEYEGPDPVSGYAKGLAWIKSRLEKA